MIIVLASRQDASARALVEGLAGQAALLTALDLSVAGWQHRVPDGWGRAVVTRSVVPAERVRVPTRLGARGIPGPYVAAEMNSFLQSWLDAIPCPVFNRPVGACLCGPGWRPEQWTLCAWRLGIPAAPITRRQALQGDSVEGPTGALQIVTLIGGRCYGSPDVGLRDATKRLAAAAGVAMLAAYFRDGCFVAADSFPDLSSPELRAGLRAAVAA